MLSNKIINWFKSSARMLLTICVCGFLFFASAYPAQAATSSSTDGEVSLNEIQAKTDDVASSNPRGIEEVAKEARKGTNAVQGSADADKMISPDEANATTIKEKASKLIDSLTN